MGNELLLAEHSCLSSFTALATSLMDSTDWYLGAISTLTLQDQRCYFLMTVDQF